MDKLAVVRLDQFSFPEEEQNDRFLYITDTHRLVVLVENQHLAAQPPRAYSILNTEDLSLLSITVINVFELDKYFKI